MNTNKIKKNIFFLTLFVISFMFACLNNLADRDLWHRLAVGKIFFQTGTVLRHDIFSYMPAKQLWIDHEWGSGVIFYFLSHFFGDYGLIMLEITSLFLVIVLIYKTHKLISPEKANYRIGFYFLSLIAILPGFTSTVRSQIFTYVFFALWIYILERVRREENRLIWIFPATMLLWVNLHGGFLSGIGLVAIYAVGEFLNRNKSLKYLGILAAIIPVTLINPYGIQFWSYMLEAATMPRPYITEWQPLNLFGKITQWAGFKLLFLFTLLGYSYKFSSKERKIDWVTVLLLIITFFLALKNQRQLVFFGISASIFSFQYFYEAINLLFGKYVKKIANLFSKKQLNLLFFTKNLIVFLFFLAIGVYCSFSKPINIVVDENDYPARAVEFVRINNLKGNLLLPFNWGSYALWKLYPQCLVSIDGRYEEVYTNQVYEQVSNFTFYENNWDKILKEYHHDIILVPFDSKIYTAIKNLKNWEIIYQDKTAAIFIPLSVKKNNFILPDKNLDYSRNKYLSSIATILSHQSFHFGLY